MPAMQPESAEYPIKVQVIRAQQQKPRFYVPIPSALAAAIGVQAGESVQWELLDRGELHLTRLTPPKPTARRRTKR
jgi:hypothetical protein